VFVIVWVFVREAPFVHADWLLKSSRVNRTDWPIAHIAVDVGVAGRELDRITLHPTPQRWRQVAVAEVVQAHYAIEPSALVQVHPLVVAAAQRIPIGLRADASQVL
jgi:hypothetical protein